MNDVSSAILYMDTVSSFTCLFDAFISSDFRIVVIRILLDSDNLCKSDIFLILITNEYAWS